MRVQMAAAESLLRMPTPPSSEAKKQIIEILRGNLALAGQASLLPKVLVASGETEGRQRMAKAVAASGFDPITVETGRDVLRRLHAANDISAILAESTLPDPGLASFLAQVRADVTASRLPFVLIAVPDNAESRDLTAKYRAERDRLELLTSRTKVYRNMRLDSQVKFERAIALYDKTKLTGATDDREREVLLLSQQHKEELQDLARQFPDAEVMDKDSREIEKRLHVLEDKYSAECQRREEALKRWLEGYPTISVVSVGLLDDPKKLRYRLFGEEGKTETKPLTEAEQKEYAEKSIQYLAHMARGEIDGYSARGFSDIKDLPEAIYSALGSGKLGEKGQADAVEVVGHLSSPAAQTKLAAVVRDEKRPLAVRIKATETLLKHVQQNSVLLAKGDLQGLRQVYEATGMEPEKQDFRAKLAILLGRLPTEARANEEQLRNYQPAPPGPPPKVEP